MKLFDSLVEKLKDRYGKSYIENYGISLVLSGLHQSSTVGTIFSISIWIYYLVVFSYTLYYSVYVQVDSELSEEAAYYAVLLTTVLAYFVAFRLMAGRLAELVRFLDNETLTYGDTLDLVTQKEISDIKAFTKKRKLVARYITIIYAGFTIYHFYVESIISGRFWLEAGDEYITRSSVTVKYPLFDARTGMGWCVDFILDSLFIANFFIVSVVVDCPFICFAEDCCEQLDILNVGIKNVNRRARYVYKVKYGREVYSSSSPEYGECLELCMKETVKHHIAAITCCRQLSRSFTAPVFVVFFTATVVICHEIMLLSDNRSDGAAMLDLTLNMSADILNCFLYAYYGERLLKANLDVNELVYAMDWESSSAAMKPYLSIIQSYTLSTTVKLSALGFFDYNYISFKNILSSAYSYYNILSATREIAEA